MSSCNKTHKLITKTLGSQVTRTWIRLSDGLEETDATVLASLEASITDADCSDCDLTKIWTISGTNGVALQQWTDNAIDTGAELPTASIFIDEDAEGYPAHVNTPDIVVTQTAFNQPNIVGVDQHQIDAWIYVPVSARLRDSAGLVETGEIYTGVCGGTMSLAESWQAAAPYSAREFATLDAGFHRLRVYINDYSPDSSGFNLQWDVDGAWSNVPPANLFLEEPELNCRNVRICGDEYVELDNTPIVLTDLDFTCEPNLCGASSTATSPMSEQCFKYRQDVLAIDNAGTSFGGNIQSLTRLVGESNGESFDLIFPIGAYEFSGTNGNNQTASIANAINVALDDN